MNVIGVCSRHSHTCTHLCNAFVILVAIEINLCVCVCVWLFFFFCFLLLREISLCQTLLTENGMPHTYIRTESDWTNNATKSYLTLPDGTCQCLLACLRIYILRINSYPMHDFSWHLSNIGCHFCFDPFDLLLPLNSTYICTFGLKRTIGFYYQV